MFNKLVRTINYDHSKDDKSFENFMKELPKHLRKELIQMMDLRKYNKISYFHKKDSLFGALNEEIKDEMQFEDPNNLNAITQDIMSRV
jgi:hypothetical protein